LGLVRTSAPGLSQRSTEQVVMSAMLRRGTHPARRATRVRVKREIPRKRQPPGDYENEFN
jgi:hypothetical protein